eukprot:scaffold62502_cov60-Phaeocystis_antarctica.AAC.1
MSPCVKIVSQARRCSALSASRMLQPPPFWRCRPINKSKPPELFQCTVSAHIGTASFTTSKSKQQTFTC